MTPALLVPTVGPAPRLTVTLARGRRRSLTQRILEMEAGMWLIEFLGRVRRWYHANDEVFFSERYKQQRAQAVLDYYAHVGDPTCG
jgi:hypothetical protein